jgi:Na+-transporting methylmalonyl-CoA/oxaloacetate decarboxylase beta subunit
MAALYLVYRPFGRDDLRNPADIQGALIDAASGPAAIAAANALAPDLNAPFAAYTALLVAATAQGGFVNCLIEGDVVGAAYAGPRRGR